MGDNFYASDPFDLHFDSMSYPTRRAAVTRQSPPCNISRPEILIFAVLPVS
jgi:hypothetical protein